MKSDSESEYAKLEKIASNFVSKCVHVILESRHVCSSSSRNVNFQRENSDVTRWDRWFNLALRDCPPALVNNDIHYSTQFAIDLVLSRQLREWNSSGDNWCWERKRGKVIERWVMMYDRNLRVSCRSRVFYKKCLLMLRSLYVTVKLLPAYNLFKKLIKSPDSCDFSLDHCISSFAEPFTREEEAEMRNYVFDPLETSYGSLCLSVLYFEPSYQMLPHRIKSDYCESVLDDPGFRPPTIHANGKVTYGSKSDDRSKKPKPSLTTESGYYVVTYSDLPATSKINGHTRETPAEGVKTACSSKSQRSPVRKASLTSPTLKRGSSLECAFQSGLSPVKNRPSAAKTSRCSEMGMCPFDFSRSEFDESQKSEECKDSFQPKLPDEAAIGSLFSIFHSAAPLRCSSTSHPNTVNPQATSTVKTTLNALQELQGYIDMKNKILQRSSNRTNNFDHNNSTIKSCAVGEDTTANVSD